MKQTSVLLMMIFSLWGLFAESSQDKTLDVLTKELKREYEILSQQSPAVHYMDYRLEKKKAWRCSAGMGCLIDANSNANNFFFANVRVGDKTLDNTHLVKGKRNRVTTFLIKTPLEEDGEKALLQAIWNRTEQAYNDASRAYSYHQNNIKVEDEKPVDDFASAPAADYYEEVEDYELSDKEKAAWQAFVTKASALFRVDDKMMKGEVSFSYDKARKYFTSSEGQHIVQNYLHTRVFIAGSVMADNGNVMNLHHAFDTYLPTELPSEEVILLEVQKIVDKLLELKTAAIAQPYTGPAILSPAAAGVFFHEIFGHRIEGQRLKDENDGQTFKTKVGESVLPKTFSVDFDPQIKKYKDFYLNGHYVYDDEGVKGEHVSVVKDGVLQNFLMSRTPIDGFAVSNGHGRADFYHGTVARQSNMFISSSKPLSDVKLRKALIKECKKQGLEYGYYFKRVTGGFTTTGRFLPNAFNVTPNEVYRIYVDGRADELVRGVDLIGTPLSMFSTIAAAGTTESVFNGTCGAESGGVPVATISPAILVRTIETQKKNQKFSTGAILPAPAHE